MKILITGGAGFIGAHLCRKFLNEGKEVICVDNLYSSDGKNIEEMKNNNNFTFINVDISSHKYNTIIEKINGIKEVYHLACPASPKYYQNSPLKTITTCVNGTINVLNGALLSNAKVLFTSTSEIYGEPLEHPQNELYRGNVNTIGIRSCYDEGKRIGETIMMEYKRLHNMNIKIVRIFNTYGEGMNKEDGRVVSNFIKQALEHKPLTIYGDGNQTRSLCYISDTVNGLIKVMESDYNGPFNIGNPNECTINYLADKIIELTLSKSNKEYHKIPSDDPTRRCPDIDSVTKLIGWKPSVDLIQGLSRMIEEFKC